jgi:hypothetical protein
MGYVEQLAAIRSLVDLGSGSDYRDRVVAGRCLASFAGRQEAWGALLTLLLDADDTLVTLETALGLVRRHDLDGWRVIAAGLASADDNSAQHIGDAVDRVLRIYASELGEAIASCRILQEDADQRIRTGALTLMEILEGIDPVLYPVPRDVTP